MAADQVSELRVVITVDDFDDALRTYRDILGMPQVATFESPGRVVLLDAGRATVELADDRHAASVDESEVGRRVAGPIRLALRVDQVEDTTRQLVDAGLDEIAPPTPTPWGSVNARLGAPSGVQLTLFGPSPDD